MKLVNLIDFAWHGDERGSLVSLEVARDIPFQINRVYYLYKTKLEVSRGFHAHRDLKQVLVCVAGSCKITLDNGATREDVILDSPQQGLLIDSLIWREMHDFSENCVLVVLASTEYDEADYLRNYDEFLAAAKSDG
jgi:dTDP-4-dehydrorhamnose 3,5-epimerase-like enzyme